VREEALVRDEHQPLPPSDKRRWDPNIQKVRALVDGSPKRINVCTSCIRSGKVVKRPIRNIPV